MKISEKKLRKIIRETLEADHPSEIEAVENAGSGDPEGKARNLELDIDHPKAAGGEGTTKSPESLPDIDDVLSERALRDLVWDIARRRRNLR